MIAITLHVENARQKQLDEGVVAATTSNAPPINALTATIVIENGDE